MCDICLQYPCHPRCPNADEPPVACECDLCNGNIYEGDAVYVIDGIHVCEDCIDNSRTYAEIDD